MKYVNLEDKKGRIFHVPASAADKFINKGFKKPKADKKPIEGNK